MINHILQILMVTSSILSLYLISNKKYMPGFTIGLLGQPIWIYTTFTADMWGAFVVSVIYLYIDTKGIINHRVKQIS